MNRESCTWREENIADLAMGRLAHEERLRLEQHLLACSRCASLYREWSEVLSPADTLPSPPPALKRRLMRSISVRRSISSLYRLRPRLLVLRVGVLALCLIGLFVLQRDSVSPASVPEHEIFPDVTMVMDPETVLHVVPGVPNNAKFYVWVNDSSNEMLILSKDLVPSDEMEYKVWFITRGRRSHVGLLHWQNGMAHLYFQGGELGQVENIAVSIEPKGSFLPATGPDAIFVNLR
ncbi:anti-sigma factor domain-containing protein [Brevibacillus sp. TJ4]|uniref:anti-sigma factor domain-containing protein n=1 Tax=Brevibacillus sp. TJ4 TaxID=3234853 RepID=UPI003BA3D716